MKRTLTVLGAALALASCSIPPTGSTYTPAALPDAASFPPVAQLLDVRCGSLNCHGTIARNLRLYGSAGLRFASTDRPLVPTCNTPDENAQDYASVVDLEPETMSAVVGGGGAHPEMLTVVRKARGAEAHKGGAVWSQGDDADTCFTSWLAGTADAAACARGVTGVVQSGTANALASCFPGP